MRDHYEEIEDSSPKTMINSQQHDFEKYNEQFGNLLDPTQQNLEDSKKYLLCVIAFFMDVTSLDWLLQIKNDAKHTFYVKNFIVEYVTNYEDIRYNRSFDKVQGLASRNITATSINSKNSRSHIVFTCISESWSKIAYFVDPSHDCLVECLPTCQSQENPPKFPPIKCEDYMLQRYLETHANLSSYKQ